ncbi:MAG: M23 family metallopeptidase [Treponema sp.]|nr:M23 family metallopeptidase [Treponema sp.]
MEIISYIGNQPKAKNILRVVKNNLRTVELPKKNKKVHIKKEVTYKVNYNTGTAAFSAGHVRRAINLKTVLVACGKALTVSGHIIASYYKLVILAAIVFTICIVAGTKISAKTAYTISHTGPLALNESDALDEASLDELMAQFANDNYSSFDEDGFLLDFDVESMPAVLFADPVVYKKYKVQSGDTIDRIARKFGLKNISTLISVNDIKNVRQLQEGKSIKVPSMDGIIYTVQPGDSIKKITDKYSVKLETFLDVNELTSETLSAGQELFIPGASLDKEVLRNAMGELWQLPLKASFRWTSPYGKRIDPIKGTPSNHTGTDMACPTGTPIYASRSGTVSFTGTSNVWGNYVIINHSNGYQTLYAHMSKIIARKGQAVDQTTKIGLVGNTGYSTGPHLHFTVYKNGKLVDPMSVLKK